MASEAGDTFHNPSRVPDDLGGNDLNDGADNIFASEGPDLVFDNGGNDTFNGNGGNDTLIGGFGNDFIVMVGRASADLVFGNEGNNTTQSGAGNNTIFGGLGNDSLAGEYAVGDTARYFGNEGADTIVLCPPRSGSCRSPGFRSEIGGELLAHHR